MNCPLQTIGSGFFCAHMNLPFFRPFWQTKNENTLKNTYTQIHYISIFIKCQDI